LRGAIAKNAISQLQFHQRAEPGDLTSHIKSGNYTTFEQSTTSPHVLKEEMTAPLHLTAGKKEIRPGIESENEDTIGTRTFGQIARIAQFPSRQRIKFMINRSASRVPCL
jgi:hypothetical protein